MGAVIHNEKIKQQKLCFTDPRDNDHIFTFNLFHSLVVINKTKTQKDLHVLPNLFTPKIRSSLFSDYTWSATVGCRP